MPYSKPYETQRILQEAILGNPSICKHLPHGVRETSTAIRFVGHEKPSIPVNWRFAEAVSALKGLETCLVNVLLQRKYGLDMQNVGIDTDHASLFVFSSYLWTLDPDGANVPSFKLAGARSALHSYFPDTSGGRPKSTYRSLATNIYRTADGRFFNLHGSFDPDPTLECLGLPYDLPVSSYEEGVKPFVQAVGAFTSEELDQRINSEPCSQSGTICLSPEEYRASAHGKANAHVGLWETHHHPAPPGTQAPSWWEDTPRTSAARPLAGLRVVDLTRVIAGPAITRSLAELGASVMRVTSPDLPDVSWLHPDLMWGKWNCSIDLKSAEGRAELRALVLEADVVVQGYRPGALDKYGFSQQDIIEMCRDRSRGVISVRENCYGWHGPWKDRSGWQQMSDASVGLSVGFGLALGHGEPVTPIFPHSDYCTGVIGSCAVICALLRRAEEGGSYAIDLALNYYSRWMADSVGEYSRPVFDEVWGLECKSPVWQHWYFNGLTITEVLHLLETGPANQRLFKQDFFEDRTAPFGTDGVKFRCLKPIADWNGTVRLGFDIGARANGKDAARWPLDLSSQFVE